MAKIDNGTLEKIKEQIGDDDSILVDGSAMLVEGSAEFFKDLVAVLPRMKNKTLIFPIEGVNKVNSALDSKKADIKALAEKAITMWLSSAIDYSQKIGSNLIFVGEATGAFSEKTILNQVSFLCGDHNVLLITQDVNMTIKARELRSKINLKDKKLHCCKIMPSGKIGLYRFSGMDNN